MLRPWQFIILIALLGLSSISSYAQRIYWTETNNNQIRVGNLSPTAITGSTIFLTYGSVRNIALDPDNDYIYFSETESVQRANMLSGGGQVEIYDKGGMSGYKDIALSVNAAGIFCTGIEDDPGAFFIDLGSQSEDQLPISGLGGDNYIGVAVNDGDEVIYWANTDRNSIIATNFSTSSGGDLSASWNGTIDRLYYDEVERKLYYTSTNGSNYYLYSYDFSTAPILLYTATAPITSICAYPQFRKAYFVVEGVGIYSVDIDSPFAASFLYSGTGITDIDILTDYSAPIFTALSPADNAVDIPAIGTDLVLTFNENVKVSTTSGTTAETSILLYRTTDNALVQTIPRASVSISGNIVTISGLPDLDYFTNYHVLIGNKTLSDLSGNNFIGITLPTGWNFRTEIDNSQYYSRQSGMWNSLGTWSHESHSGPAISTGIPSCTGCDIFIGNGHTITLNDNEETVGNNSGLTIEAGGTLNAAGFSFGLGGDLNVKGSLLNPGDLISNFGGINIYNSSGNPLVLNGLILNDNLDGEVTLHTDIVLLNGITTLAGGTLNQNGFNICNGAGLPPTSPVFTSVSDNSLTLSWTPGAGNAFIVMREGSTSFKPQIGSTYTANSVFGSGQQTGTGNYAVYNGAGTTVTITGLTPSTMYEFDMYSFSSTVGGCYTVSNYQFASQQTCVTVTAPTTPTDAAYCSGESKPAITVADPGSGKTIRWYDASTGGNLVTGDVSGGAGRGEVFIPNAASGTFYAETFDGTFSCVSSTRTAVTLTMRPALVSGTASTLQTVCEGGDPVSITGGTASGGDGTFTYEWESSSTSGGTFTTVTGAESETYDPPSGILATTYFHRIVKSATCKMGSAEIPVMVVSPPVIVSNPTDVQRCEGETATFETSATGTAVTYQWRMDNGSGFSSITDGGVFSGATTGQLQISNVTGLNNTRFECEVMSSGVCPISSSVAVLTTNPLPAFANQSPEVCETVPGSGSVTFDLTSLDNDITGGVSDRSISWFTTAALSTPVPGATATTATDGTVFHAKVTNTLTNCYSAATATITVKAKPVVAATTLKTICSGTSTAITFSATPGSTTYAWTVSANGNITGASGGTGGGINQVLNNSATSQQTITYSVTPSANGCSGTLFTQSITVDPRPTIFNVTGGGSYCVGTTGVNIGLSNSQNGITYSLLLAGNPTGITASPGGGAFSFPQVTAVGTYTISASSVANCPQLMNGAVQVSVSSSPTGGSILSSKTSQLCVDDEVTFSATGVTNAPSSFNWVLPSGIEEVSRGTNTIIVRATGGTGGLIFVAATNACGDGPTFSTTVAVSALPVVEIILPERAYVDDPVVFSFTASEAGNPSWIFSDGQTSSEEIPLMTFTSAGDLSIKLDVTNSAGCTGTASDKLTIRSSDIGNLAIKNVVTANGDDANGFLYIEQIEKYPDSEVILIDRWGTEVFRKKGYDNTWDLKKGEDYLPAGNYICVVRYEGKVYSRTVTVIKNN